MPIFNFVAKYLNNVFSKKNLYFLAFSNEQKFLYLFIAYCFNFEVLKI